MIKTTGAMLLMLASTAVFAAPETYKVDPDHTYPSFEADHQGGMSVWRGKIEKTSGTITLDRAAKSGNVDVTMDMSTINFGHEGMNKHAKSGDILDVAQFPTATYKGKISKFNGDAPAEVDGELTLHGVTKPVKLVINSFLCKQNPMTKKDACGADASASFNRDEFGVELGKTMGFKMPVKLAIQVEAVKQQ